MKYFTTFLGILTIMLAIIGVFFFFALPVIISVITNNECWLLLWFVIIPGLFTVGHVIKDWINR